MSRVTSNAKVDHSPEAVYEISAIRVDPHRFSQFQPRLASTRLNGIIYVTKDVRSLPQRLRQSYKAGYAPNRKYNNPEGSKLASRYN